MNQEKIGKFILELRKEKNMTQQDLADKLGVTDRAISKWENGRGLPDYSLIKPLCDELDISINDLLCGEKIDKNDYREKSEENILNTINYSNNEIKNNKKRILFISLIVIGIIVFIVTCFGIDMGRMINNQEVIFSTWGFDYYPPINLNEENIEKAIKDYFSSNETARYENEKFFVALKTFLIDEKKESTFVYAWILMESYYEKDGEIIQDSGFSIPYKIELAKKDNKYTVINYQIPRDGSYYAKDLKTIFPRSVLRDMNKVHSDGTIERLQFAIKEQVELYFN